MNEQSLQAWIREGPEAANSDLGRRIAVVVWWRTWVALAMIPVAYLCLWLWSGTITGDGVAGVTIGFTCALTAMKITDTGG